MLLRFTGFAGANLALHPLLLPDGVGTQSNNQRPGRGDLRPWRTLSTVATAISSAQTIYRMGRDAVSDSQYWLSWNTDVDVARGFLATDTTERTYWTGDGAPKWTDNTFGLSAAPYPTAARFLGVPAPDAAPTVAVTSAGSGDSEDRAFVTVWVNDKGEVSAPSAATAFTSNGGSALQVTRNATVPSGSYGIASWRVYVTVPGNATAYFLAGQAASGSSTLTIVDISTGVNTAAALESETWIMPPSDLKGLTALWNGIMAGFIGKSLRFSVPFRPYAWPIEYEIVLDDTIVGLARWRQQLVVLTTGKPYVVTGSSPEGMSSQLVELAQSCVAKKSIVELGHGVAWASPNGMAYIGDAGAKLLTADIALREDWQAFVPTTMVAGQYNGLVICSYDPGTGRKSFALDPLKPLGFFFCDLAFTAARWDPLADGLFVLNGTNIQKWHAGGSVLTATASSKIMRTSRPATFAFAQVVADSYPVTFSLFAQGVQKVTNMSVPNGKAFRLPAGFRADEWRVVISTTGAVQLVLLAQSIEELI